MSKQQKDISEQSADELLVGIYRQLNSIKTILSIFLGITILALLFTLKVL